jgi:hypothetical protein
MLECWKIVWFRQVVSEEREMHGKVCLEMWRKDNFSDVVAISKWKSRKWDRRGVERTHLALKTEQQNAREHSNEHLGSIIFLEFLGQLSYC